MNDRRALILILSLAWSILAPPTWAAVPVKVIFDTDMETDCDDGGALAILHSLADLGECQIIACGTSVLTLDALATVDVINRYRGRPGIPLGQVKGQGVRLTSKFSRQIATEFPHRVKSASEIPDAAHLYRDVLAEQPDHSVTMITVGYLTNLKNLLALPATDQHASGIDIVRAKVSQYVCMGGNFIGYPPKDDLALGNVNFCRDADSAFDVLNQWPTEIVFAGREVCSVPSGVRIGESLRHTPADNPVRRVYELYSGGQASNRHVADLAAVYYAIRGITDCWDLSAPGKMQLQKDLQFEWAFTPQGKQRYLLKKPNKNGQNDRHVEATLDKLLIKPKAE
ncbi:MAG: nucleoside hydrolase [Verrucomicrobia bacterium]|nr:nucleoside hydrolase [Verrucomicrobiota bacterium]